MSQESVALLADAIADVGDGLLLVVSGAGISLASGIPTFRGSDPEAVWKRDLTELASNRYFLEDPAGSWEWYTSRFDIVLDKRPNDAHRSLVDLERWQTARGGRFLLVTQNVDPLHERAGSRALVKVHGSADRVRCSRRGCVHGPPSGSLPRPDVELARFRDDPVRANVPTCPACGSLLRQHVLWFDEMYTEHDDYQWPRVLDAAAALGLALFVGTSFAVGVTALVLEAGLRRGRPLFSVDPGADTAPHPAVQLLPEKAEILLPAVCRRLGAAT